MMRRYVLVVLVIFTLFVIVSLSSPARSIHAQESTPPADTSDSPDGTLAPIPTLFPTTNDPLLVSIPFGETFDTNWGWESDGVWVFDPATAYDGGGWYVDGLTREMNSTLTYNFPIDLHGTLSVQLVYRHRGKLPGSDLIAVDLSLDGGETWFSIDQQIGLATDWDRHIVDLTDYRGQVIRLRFRVTTGVQLPGDDATPDATATTPTEEVSANTEDAANDTDIASAAITADPEGTATNAAALIPEGYWLDNLTIQYVVQPAVAVDYNGPRTHLGLHLVVGAQREPVLALAEQLRKIGRPLGTVKGITGTEDILNAVKAESPETVIVFRSMLNGDGKRTDCPNLHNDPVAEAQQWIAGYQTYWHTVNADYFEIMNECQYPASWLLPFSIEAMRVASTYGECILLFSFGVGNPDPAQYYDLLPAYQYALDNPCGPGKHHGIAMHAYGYGKTTLVSESGIYLGLRHRLAYAIVLSEIPDAIKLPVYLTEAGPGDGRADFSCQDVTRDVVQYTRELELDPYIRGFHLWNIGPLQPWTDFTSCLPMIGNALVNYYGG
ncbi:MAG: hypothetical protein JXA10_17655 [Anaerolineae bacterium]|nr:hypothetical protein [Anaerolineae bacterium]